MTNSRISSATTVMQSNGSVTAVDAVKGWRHHALARSCLAFFLTLCATVLIAPVFADDHAKPDPFIAADFEPPLFVDAGQFVLKPLGPELVEIDYAAYMSSIEHIRTTFSTSGSWPHEDISMADAMVDMQNEQRRFEARESFAYAVLTPDEQVELGCVYVYPSSKKGFDAVIRLWVTKDQFDAGFDSTLYRWTTTWIEDAWPFSAAAYPGRAIPWEDWNGLEDQG